MPALDLAQIRYFNAVARHGSFSAAAKTLGITQPGLTKAVRRLETSLDCSLFVRMPRGIALTPQGEALLRHASLLDIQLQDAREEVRSWDRGTAGELRIGAGPSWLTRALPRIVSEMAARHPKLHFRVTGNFNGMLIESVRNGELDLAVTALPDRTPAGLRAIPLTTDMISVVARPGHPLRAKRAPQPAGTHGYDWALPGRDVLSRQRLEALFRVAGLEPPVPKVESDSISFIAAVLRESDMLSFATSQILHNEMDGIAPLAIAGLTMRRSAGILYRSSSGLTAAMRELIEAAEKLAKDLGAN
jgi:DNA-binding transcriptional LysR family regulator